MALVTVYDVRCRVRLAHEKLVRDPAGVPISGGTWRDEDTAIEVAGNLARFDAYVMPIDIPEQLVNSVCDDADAESPADD